jgi:dTDP-4-dehydrorhamnose 3,5-epimerase
MKILDVTSLQIDAVKLIKFARFCDHRGYFTEHFRSSDFEKCPDIGYMKGIRFLQANESLSRPGTIRGLHFQWDPYMGKLVRTLAGRMVDMALDIRKGSPTFGKIVCHDMPSNKEGDAAEWIWVPPGFAHGNFFVQETLIEYLCSGEHNRGCEAGISPIAEDIDWSLCDVGLRRLFEKTAATTQRMTDKDRNGLTVAAWKSDPRSDSFVYGNLPAM